MDADGRTVWPAGNPWNLAQIDRGAESLAGAIPTRIPSIYSITEESMTKETLTWSDYQFYAEKKSLIDPDKSIRVQAGFGCPHCHEVVNNPVTIQHGQTYVHKCGLRMTVYGNALDCELDERKVVKVKSEAEWPSEV
jgi:hypothetical protein